MAKGTLEKMRQELDDLGIAYEQTDTYFSLKAKLDKAKGVTAKAEKKEEAPAPEMSRDEVKGELEGKVARMEALLEKLLKERGDTPVPVHGALSQDDLVKALMRAADGKKDEYGLLSAEYIPADDLLEKPITYYMTGPTVNIWGKRVGNNWTLPPLGHKFLKFEMKIGWTTRTGDGLKQRRISTFECMSRTLSEWIESLPQFGRSIYRNMDSALDSSQDTAMIDAFNTHYGMLQNMDFAKITKLAHEQYGIPTSINADHNFYAAKIAEIRAKDDMERQRVRFEEELRKQGVQSMIATPA